MAVKLNLPRLHSPHRGLFVSENARQLDDSDGNNQAARKAVSQSILGGAEGTREDFRLSRLQLERGKYFRIGSR